MSDVWCLPYSSATLGLVRVSARRTPDLRVRNSCMRRRRMQAHKLDAYPTNDGSFPLLVVFDDSLHNRWAAAPEGVQPEFDAAVDIGRLSMSQRVPCGQSIRATFKQGDQPLMLRASEPVVISNATAPLLLSLAFTLSAAVPLQCAASPARGRCEGPVCVSMRMQQSSTADTYFVPLCGQRQGPLVSTADSQRWQHMQIPLQQFGHLRTMDELVIVAGTVAPNQMPLIVCSDVNGWRGPSFQAGHVARTAIR